MHPAVQALVTASTVTPTTPLSEAVAAPVGTLAANQVFPVIAVYPVATVHVVVPVKIVP